MGVLIRFLVLLTVKGLSHLFFRFEVNWVTDGPPTSQAHREAFKNLKLIVLLNHTSLFEPILVGCMPAPFLWHLARFGIFPAAEKTMKRPILGRFIKLLGSQALSVTRLRDETWSHFLSRIHPSSLVIILPEGRMKRANGLDLDGNPMTVRGGIADILQGLTHGKMLIGYSGGLHHIQVPGEGLPRIFKKVRIALEFTSIEAYKQTIGWDKPEKQFKIDVIKDLERRRDIHCPSV